MKSELTPELRERIDDLSADTLRSKSVKATCSELGLQLQRTPIKIDGRETRLDSLVTDSELEKIVADYKKSSEHKKYPPMPPVRHQVIENSDLHNLLLLIKQPGAMQAIENLASVHAKKRRDRQNLPGL